MNILSGLGGETAKSYDMHNALAGQSSLAMKPRTLREQLQDRMASHQRQIADLQEALDALTPDVEKALNALAKI